MERPDKKPFNDIQDAKSIFDEFVASITLNESRDEVRSVALIILEKIMGIKSTDVLAGKHVHITERLSAAMSDALKRINHGEPAQYVVGEAFFYGRSFIVKPSVLIPRPETEELIREVLSSDARARTSQARVLDIGTGSGCLSITLSLELKDAIVFATDISKDALAVAKRNAETHGASVTFIEHDILKDTVPVPDLDIIVSNPPYVTWHEADHMQTNVKDFEPHLALFVPNDDPLLFYRTIVEQAAVLLRIDGLLAVEINENYSREVSELFSAAGFKEIRILNDIPGKPRVVRGRK